MGRQTEQDNLLGGRCNLLGETGRRSVGLAAVAPHCGCATSPIHHSAQYSHSLDRVMITHRKQTSNGRKNSFYKSCAISS